MNRDNAVKAAQRRISEAKRAAKIRKAAAQAKKIVALSAVFRRDPS